MPGWDAVLRPLFQKDEIMKSHTRTNGRRIRLAAVALAAFALAGCSQEVLDFRNADLVNGKIYADGANKPFSGKVTNIPFSTLPTSPLMKMFHAVSHVTEDRDGIEVAKQLRNLHCDVDLDEGLLDGDASCTLRGMDGPYMTMRYEKGSLEGAVKVASIKAKGVTLAQATYKDDAIEGELIINHPETGKLISSSHWRASKQHGSEETYSLKTGKLIYKATFVDGQPDGEVLSYRPDGEQLLSKVHFVAGKPHGIEEGYYREGQLMRRIQWVEGRSVKQEFWNEQGQLIDNFGRLIGGSNESPSPQTSGASSTGCVDGWTAAFRKENGDDAMVTMDQLGEWEDWCRQGKVAR